MKSVLFLSVCSMLFFSCKNKLHPSKEFYSISYNEGRFIIKDSCDTLGNILQRKYFNEHMMPDGAEIDYYPSRKIKKWKWCDMNSQYPDCIVYYHNDGSFDTFVGKPYIEIAQNHEHQICIALPNPPNAKGMLGYLDSFDGKQEKKIAYNATLTDTTGWVVLDKHNPQKGHKYTLQFMIVDNDNYIIYQIQNELYNEANGKYSGTINSHNDSFAIYNIHQPNN